MFHIEGRKNYLADQGSRHPTGGAGNDRGDRDAGEDDSAKITGAASADIRANTAGLWPTMDLPTNDCYPNFAQIFAYGPPLHLTMQKSVTMSAWTQMIMWDNACWRQQHI